MNTLRRASTAVFVLFCACNTAPAAAGDAKPASAAIAAAPAAIDPFAGTFVNTDYVVEIRRDGAKYSGTVSEEGERYPLQGVAKGGVLSGTIAVDGESLSFKASLRGDVITFDLEGDVYTLNRKGGTPKGAVAGAKKTPERRKASASVKDGNEVLAKTPFAKLTRDSAIAFHEALLFSLAYTGVDARTAEKELPQEKVVAAVAKGFSSLPFDVQTDLANARAIWTNVRTNWGTTSDAEKKEFVSEVLELAFGKEAKRYGGPAGRTASTAKGSLSGSGLPSVDAPYAGSDCWASAGCVDYDSGSDSYTYESPSFDGGSYE